MTNVNKHPELHPGIVGNVVFYVSQMKNMWFPSDQTEGFTLLASMRTSWTIPYCRCLTFWAEHSHICQNIPRFFSSYLRLLLQDVDSRWIQSQNVQRDGYFQSKEWSECTKWVFPHCSALFFWADFQKYSWNPLNGSELWSGLLPSTHCIVLLM